MRPASHIAGSMVNGTRCTPFGRVIVWRSSRICRRTGSARARLRGPSTSMRVAEVPDVHHIDPQLARSTARRMQMDGLPRLCGL